MFLEVWKGLGRAWEGLGMAFGRIGKTCITDTKSCVLGGSDGLGKGLGRAPDVIGEGRGQQLYQI